MIEDTLHFRDKPVQRGIVQFLICSNGNHIVSDWLPSASSQIPKIQFKMKKKNAMPMTNMYGKTEAWLKI